MCNVPVVSQKKDTWGLWILGTLLVTIKYRKTECGSREISGRSDTWQGRTCVFHESLWSSKGQWAFLPMSRKSKPLPGVVGTRFPRIPFAMWFWFRAAQRGSCRWKKSSYYCQEGCCGHPWQWTSMQKASNSPSIFPLPPTLLPAADLNPGSRLYSTGTVVIAIRLLPRGGRSQTPLPRSPFRVPGMLMIWLPTISDGPTYLCFTDCFSGPLIPSF